MIRPASPDDVTRIVELVRDLAAYEKEPEQAVATETDFTRVLFPAQGTPSVFAHVAEAAGEVVGIAVWFLTFSTWTGTNGIWLEDLYVAPEHRGSGLGRQLLATLARTCVERGYQRLEWTVLDWNEPSIAFYRSLGAVPLDGWTSQRVDGERLARLGGGAG